MRSSNVRSRETFLVVHAPWRKFSSRSQKKTKPQTMPPPLTCLLLGTSQKSRHMLFPTCVLLLLWTKGEREREERPEKNSDGSGEIFYTSLFTLLSFNLLCIQLSYQRAINRAKAASALFVSPSVERSHFHLNYTIRPPWTTTLKTKHWGRRRSLHFISIFRIMPTTTWDKKTLLFFFRCAT